jgi:hypothetical protein
MAVRLSALLTGRSLLTRKIIFCFWYPVLLEAQQTSGPIADCSLRMSDLIWLQRDFLLLIGFNVLLHTARDCTLQFTTHSQDLTAVVRYGLQSAVVPFPLVLQTVSILCYALMIATTNNNWPPGLHYLTHCPGTAIAIATHQSTLRSNTMWALFLDRWSLSPWWWRRHVPPKRRFIQEPRCATSQKTAFFILTAMKTSNLASYFVFEKFLDQPQSDCCYERSLLYSS